MTGLWRDLLAETDDDSHKDRNDKIMENEIHDAPTGSDRDVDYDADEGKRTGRQRRAGIFLAVVAAAGIGGLVAYAIASDGAEDRNAPAAPTATSDPNPDAHLPPDTPLGGSKPTTTDVPRPKTTAAPTVNLSTAARAGRAAANKVKNAHTGDGVTQWDWADQGVSISRQESIRLSTAETDCYVRFAQALANGQVKSGEVSSSDQQKWV